MFFYYDMQTFNSSSLLIYVFYEVASLGPISKVLSRYHFYILFVHAIRNQFDFLVNVITSNHSMIGKLVIVG